MSSASEIKYVPVYPPFHKSLTPNDTTVFDNPMIIRVLTAGNVAVADLGGNVVTYTGVPAFTDIPVMATKLMATNTTATGFVGLYGQGTA